MKIPESSIFYQLRNYEKNKRMLEMIPHIRYLDLAIVFYFSEQEKECEKVMLITNEKMKEWQISVQELEKYASVNTPRSYPLFFATLNEVLQELCEKCDVPVVLAEDEIPMYAISNEKKVFGAAALIYPGALRKISQKLKDNFYILPSSIHECILIPEKERCSKEDLLDIVHEVNVTQVPPEEFLSDNIYLYNGDEDCIWQLSE